MKRTILISAIFLLVFNAICFSQAKDNQPFKFNIIKSDSIALKDLSPMMELVAADKNLEVLSYDLVFYMYENTYKFSMNGSKLAESIVVAIKKLNPKPKKMVVDNIVALNQTEGKEISFKGFTVYLK